MSTSSAALPHVRHEQLGVEYAPELFERSLMREGSYGVEPADHGSDDACYADRENPDLVPNPGHRVVSKGEAEGKLVGGHPRTFCLPFGKEFMPDPEATIFLLGRDKKSGRSEAASVASITNTRA